MNRNPLEILFDNVLAGAAYASQSSDSASAAAQEHADSHHRPYEVRVTCDTSQRIIKTIEPRKSK